jgi:hypothetical protein
MSKIIEGEKKPRNKNPLLFQHPCRGVICGSSGTGKTRFILEDIVLHKDSPFDKVIFVAPKFSLEQEKLQIAKDMMGERMILIEGLNEAQIQEELENSFYEGNQTLIIFDDLMNKKSRYMTDLFTSGRHRNASIVELTQRIFTDGRRTNRCNTDYYVIFNFGDKLEFRNLALQLEPKHFKEIMELYDDATEDPHGCLIIDLKHKVHKDFKDNRMLKYRKNNMETIYDDIGF